MNVKDILKKELIVLLTSKNKEAVLDELLEVICKNNLVQDKEAVKEQFLDREALMSTGIGLGIGVPHIRTDKIHSPVIAVGVLPDGIEDYVALDDHPVKIVFMIMIKTGEHKAYIGLLSQIATVLKNDRFRFEFLKETTTEGLYNKLYKALEAMNE